MIFALIKIGGTRHGNHSYAYYSVIMEMGASTKWSNIFESEDEMITVMNGILARQKRGGDARQWLNEIRDGYHYFFDLDLTLEEAEALGWKQTPTTMNP
jgi:hypothetical protein